MVSASSIKAPIGWRRSLLSIKALSQSPVARRAWTNNFLKEISYTHGSPRSLGQPQVFELETTNACPYTCIMCPRTHAMTRPIGHMDLSLFRDIVDQIEPAWQMDHIRAAPTMRLLHYGEPLVYRHYAESVEHCHRRGFSVYISTNPSVWTEERIEQTLDVGVDDLWVMVDGLDDATSTAIRGSAASFTRGERNIRELAKRKVHRGLTRPRITIAMIKQPRNRHQWSRFEECWADIDGIDATYLAHFSTFDGSVEKINAINQSFAVEDPDQARQVERQRVVSQYPCYYPWHSVSVTWNGQVVPCCRDFDAGMVLGDLNRRSLREIWNAPPIQQLRRRFSEGKPIGRPCETCQEASLEIGLPGRHYAMSRYLRRAGIGKMNRMHVPSSDSHLGPQNVNRRMRAPAETQRELEPVS